MSKDISVEKKKNFPFSNEISAWFKDIDMNYVVQYSVYNDSNLLLTLTSIKSMHAFLFYFLLSLLSILIVNSNFMVAITTPLQAIIVQSYRTRVFFDT